jgi:hypothetical protein
MTKPAKAGFCDCATKKALFAVREGLAAAACAASARNASVTGAASGHDVSGGGAGGRVAYVVHGTSRVSPFIAPLVGSALRKAGA